MNKKSKKSDNTDRLTESVSDVNDKGAVSDEQSQHTNPADNIQEKLNAYAKDKDTDIIVYFGKIEKPYDDFIINECRKRKLRSNVLLILATYGGNPDAAYRIARCLQKAYKTKNDNDSFNSEPIQEEKKGIFKIFIDGPCKSAGTLICLGADEIIMSGNAELGPIDMQLSKKDEVGESESGLTPMQALESLEYFSERLFRRHFHRLRFSDMAFSTKMAADIASELTRGLLSPVYAQIDPMRIAEVNRSMQIAKEYGHRLKTENVKNGTVEQLLTGYPSHGFVIDRTEAKKLFEKISTPDPELREIANFLRELDTRHFVNFLSLGPLNTAGENNESK